MARALHSLAACLLLAIVMVMLAPARAQACTGVPFDRLVPQARAALHGMVVDVSSGGRRATLEVLGYAGPGEAPRLVELPATERSSPPDTKCEDESIRFRVGQEYIVLLGDIPPTLSLADPRGDTARPVGPWEGDEFAAFAREHGFGLAVKPGPGAPVWRSGLPRSVWGLVGGGAVVALGLLVWLTRQHRGGAS